MPELKKIEGRALGTARRICDLLDLHWKTAPGPKPPHQAITVVCDFPLLKALSGDATISAAIATAVEVLWHRTRFGSDDPHPVEGDEWLKAPVTKELWQAPWFRAIWKLGFQLETLLCEYRPDGHHLWASLAPGQEPVVFTRKSTPYREEEAELEFIVNDDVWSHHPRGRLLSELIPPSKARALLDQFDVALCSTGPKTINSRDVFQEHRTFRQELGRDFMTASRLLRALRSDDAKGRPRFAELAEHAEEPGEAQSAATPRVDGEARRAQESEQESLQEKRPIADTIMDAVVVQSAILFERLSRAADRSEYALEFIKGVGRGQNVYRMLLASVGADSAHEVVRRLARARADAQNLEEQLRGRDETAQYVSARLVGPGRAQLTMLIGTPGSLNSLEETLEAARQEGVQAYRVWHANGRDMHGDAPVRVIRTDVAAVPRGRTIKAPASGARCRVLRWGDDQGLRVEELVVEDWKTLGAPGSVIAFNDRMVAGGEPVPSRGGRQVEIGVLRAAFASLAATLDGAKGELQLDPAAYLANVEGANRENVQDTAVGMLDGRLKGLWELKQRRMPPKNRPGTIAIQFHENHGPAAVIDFGELSIPGTTEMRGRGERPSSH